MSMLVPIHSAAFGAETIPTVNARELHAKLRTGRDFSNWIKGRIDKYGFLEGEDYVTTKVSAKSGENLGGRPTIDYHLALDMAKELAMLENNPQGRAARRYFIAAEKALRAVAPLARAEILRAHPEWAKIARYDALGLNYVEIGRLLGCNESTVRRARARMTACGLLPCAVPGKQVTA